MELNADKILEDAIKSGIRECIASKLAGYQSPLDKLLSESISKHNATLRALLEDSIASCLKDESWRENIASAVRQTLAKQLVAKFGGELEKQVNLLKSDPTTRARITLAIEEIVKQRAS